MRLAQLLGLVLLATCVNGASGSLNETKAQTGSESESSARNWVLTMWTEESSTITNVEEITRTSRGSLLVVSVTYYSRYEPEYKLRGYYLMARDEVNCASKSSASREVQLYSLRGSGIDQRFESNEPLRQSFPETYARMEIDNVCRIAESGPNKDDATFASVPDFIRISERVFPPQGPTPSKAAPKSKAKPR